MSMPPRHRVGWRRGTQLAEAIARICSDRTLSGRSNSSGLPMPHRPRRALGAPTRLLTGELYLADENRVMS
jgi:hypothetical protein